MTSKRRRAVAGTIVFLFAAAVLAWLAFWTRPLLEVAVAIRPDGGESLEVYSRAISLPRNDEDWSAFECEIDLTRWAGRLVRVDIDAKVKTAQLVPVRRGSVACCAELTAASERRALEFSGWKNNGSEWLHFGAVGCLGLGSATPSSSTSTLSTDGLLWHALKVPPQSVLRLVFTPMPSQEMGGLALCSSGAGEAQILVPLLSGVPKSLRSPRPPDVFICLIDAVRADHLGCYGYTRPTSPHIDRFSASATLYQDAQTAATWTKPSVATLLSGLYPFVHGAVHMKRDELAEWVVLLPEILREHGYGTWAIIANPPVSARFGFDQGYDGFDYKYRGSAQWANHRLKGYLSSQGPNQPVFAYLHTMEPHAPYSPAEESFRRFDRGFDGQCDGSVEALLQAGRIRPKLSQEDIEHLVDRYDAEIFEADRGFAEFLQILRSAGRLDNSLIVLLADHGEAFGDHDTLEHGNTLNQEELHVPLIIQYPEGRFSGLRVDQRVSLVDVVPTILREVGVELEFARSLPGSALHPDVLTEVRGRRIHCEVSRYDSDRLDLVGVIDEDGYKLVVDMSKPRGARATKESIGLWDTGTDETEAVHIEVGRPVRAAYCEQLIAEWLAEQRELHDRLVPKSISRPEMSEELERELRGLGYVD